MTLVIGIKCKDGEDKIILELSKKEVNDLFVLITEYLDLVKRENGVSRLGKKLREKLKNLLIEEEK